MMQLYHCVKHPGLRSYGHTSDCGIVSQPVQDDSHSMTDHCMAFNNPVGHFCFLKLWKYNYICYRNELDLTCLQCHCVYDLYCILFLYVFPPVFMENHFGISQEN